MLAFAQELIKDEQLPANEGRPAPFSAFVTLKTELARQYAESADHNRRINKRRERMRSVAGLAALGSVAMTVFLVASTYAHYLTTHEQKGAHHEAVRIATTGQPVQDPGPDTNRIAGEPDGAGAAAYAARDKGVVDPARGVGER